MGSPARGGHIAELWVITPMGFTPPPSTLQGPVAGQCINHPSTVDLAVPGSPGPERRPAAPVRRLAARRTAFNLHHDVSAMLVPRADLGLFVVIAGACVISASAGRPYQNETCAIKQVVIAPAATTAQPVPPRRCRSRRNAP